jgi:hypothetical protein
MSEPSEGKPLRVWADGLFGDILCLSHGDTSTVEGATEITLRAGMKLIAFDQDVDDKGNRDDLIATGIVEPSPKSLRCNGSRGVLRIDENGVRNESDIRKKE